MTTHKDIRALIEEIIRGAGSCNGERIEAATNEILGLLPVSRGDETPVDKMQRDALQANAHRWLSDPESCSDGIAVELVADLQTHLTRARAALKGGTES